MGSYHLPTSAGTHSMETRDISDFVIKHLSTQDPDTGKMRQGRFCVSIGGRRSSKRMKMAPVEWAEDTDSVIGAVVTTVAKTREEGGASIWLDAFVRGSSHSVDWIQLPGSAEDVGPEDLEAMVTTSKAPMAAANAIVTTRLIEANDRLLGRYLDLMEQASANQAMLLGHKIKDELAGEIAAAHSTNAMVEALAPQIPGILALINRFMERAKGPDTPGSKPSAAAKPRDAGLIIREIQTLGIELVGIAMTDPDQVVPHADAIAELEDICIQIREGIDNYKAVPGEE